MLNGTDAYVKAALFGLGLYLGAAVVILVSILVFSPSDAIFGLILIIPGLVAVAALRYIRRWGLVIGALLSGFGLMSFMGDAGLDLSSPQAFLNFLLTLFTLVGLGISFLASLIGFIQYFRGPVGGEVVPSASLVLRGVSAVIIVAALVSLVLTVINATQSVSAADKQGALALTAEDTKWSATTLDAAAGQPVRILVKNDDPILHTFTVKDSARGLDIDVHLGPWSEQIVELGTLQPGIYGYICRVEGHSEDMSGALTVR